eukprot:TRINITY_DN11436_c0_g1_i1.p2 TRINITY_DN11436_c0_g1~~TRINITY_DN11436_c0_g1_i1.p2  ORF type:complete len:162 (+),score=68.05 TRINITY_DN11436_c0_g1_i1:57-488(+)
MADEERDEGFEEEATNADLIAQLTQSAQARAKDVEGMLASSNIAGALARSLEDPPCDAKSDDTPKNLSAEAVARVLAQVKEPEIKKYLGGLDAAQRDLLMKYVYRALRLNLNAGHMFKWHAEIVAVAGVGCIVRAMADRKSVA